MRCYQDDLKEELIQRRNLFHWNHHPFERVIDASIEVSEKITLDMTYSLSTFKPSPFIDSQPLPKSLISKISYKKFIMQKISKSQKELSKILKMASKIFFMLPIRKLEKKLKKSPHILPGLFAYLEFWWIFKQMSYKNIIQICQANLWRCRASQILSFLDKRVTWFYPSWGKPRCKLWSS